jgi:RHS repeat-associated protein
VPLSCQASSESRNARTIAAVSGYGACTQSSLSLTVSNNNRVNSSGFAFDAAGNLTTYPSYGSHTYDAENRLTSTAGVTYTYDGDGRSAKKSNGKLYWYGAGSDVLMETDLVGTLQDEYVFFNGQRIARRTASGAVYYFFSDHLGSSRIMTDSAGTVVEDSDFYPFGGERVVVDTLNNNYKFTGQERDAESGLDYFIARHYAFTLARFLQPDPVKITPGRMRDPQQLNSFTYVRNNPLRFIDSDGETLQISGDVEEAKKQLCETIGGDCTRITYDPDTNTITVDLTGIDLSVNEGALLVDQLVGSSNVYNLTLGDTVETAGGPVKFDTAIILDNRPDDRYSRGKRQIDLPPQGVDAVIGVNPRATLADTQNRVVPTSNLVFHELAEAYARVDGGKPYGDSLVVNKGAILVGSFELGAHSEAAVRELRLREQRPHLKGTGFAGDKLTIIREPK